MPEIVTNIRSNGSKWAGKPLDSIDTLLEVMEENRLNVELFGQFVYWCDPVFLFFGNFLDISNVFSIQTNDPEIVGSLSAAIARNLLRQEPAAECDKCGKPLPEDVADGMLCARCFKEAYGV